MNKNILVMTAAIAIFMALGVVAFTGHTVLADSDEGQFQGHFGDTHNGDEYHETCISLGCCHDCGGGHDDN